MRRLQALVVLLVVSFNAAWCLDGCVDPFGDLGSHPGESATLEAPSDGAAPSDASTCVMCVVPFEREAAVRLAPSSLFGALVPAFNVVRPPLAPGHQVEHPPRLL